MQTQKHTAWKKNRKFGDIFGGRKRLKLDDNIFKRYHNLKPPTPNDERPIFLRENPSRDFYYPATFDEIKETLSALPNEHTSYITHIWLDNVKKDDYLQGKSLQGQFVCGSKVYAIKLFAVSTDNRLYFGKTKPLKKSLTFYKNYSTELLQDEFGFYLQFTDITIKKYFLEKLLLHEIGHCVDYVYKRQWSNANTKQVEDFADNYASVWSNTIRETIDKY